MNVGLIRGKGAMSPQESVAEGSRSRTYLGTSDVPNRV